ncbi:MAG: hypothetical protein HYY17_11750 [Planctomycetes bacterium]|nr:hypothetical protein [Planctomycetota bacterium]
MVADGASECSECRRALAETARNAVCPSCRSCFCASCGYLHFEFDTSGMRMRCRVTREVVQRPPMPV